MYSINGHTGLKIGSAGAALASEWVLGDGRGGYASSSLAMCPTRRFHGLLVAPLEGSTLRHVFVSHIEESAEWEGGQTLITPALYGAHEDIPTVPMLTEVCVGEDFTARVALDDQTALRRRVHTSPKGTAISYAVGPDSRAITLTLRPMFSCRPFNRLAFENSQAVIAAEGVAEGSGLRVQPYAELPPVFVMVSSEGWEWSSAPVWYRDVALPQDEARGEDFREDRFCPGVVRVALEPGAEVTLQLSIGRAAERAPAPVTPRPCAAQPGGEAKVAGEAPQARDATVPPLIRALDRAADAFLYQRPTGGRGILAGFPWFDEWGRDTFISLPGLLLARDRVDAAREIAETTLRFIRGGLVPNIFGSDTHDSHYGSADAALWFARAVSLIDRAVAGPRREQMRQRFFKALRDIAEAHIEGTDLGLRTRDGLLLNSDPTRNATWMDAMVNGAPVTPRDGYAVEINALWIVLLRTIETWAADAGDRAEEKRWREHRRRADRRFIECFWLEDEGYLADRYVNGRPDRSVRPNMVLAAAFEHSPLTQAQRRSVVERAGQELLTPRGLRTLSPSDPNYIGRYAGSSYERDTAYHRGTVWPWLSGFYVEALLRSHRRSRRRDAEAQAHILGFGEHLAEAGIGQISEVFDGDAPHRPGGTIAQAWSVAELLRGWRLANGVFE